MADALLTLLLDGDIIGFILACYTTTLGMFFYGWLLMMISVVTYARYHNLAILCIMWLLLGSVFEALTMVFSPIAIVMITLGLSGTVYSVFHKEDVE